VGSGFSAVALESEISGLQSELTYHYRLVAANQADTVYGIDQVFQTGAVTSAGDPVIRPDGYALDRNFPNPFNPSTTITYTLPVTARVAVKIFDLHGRDVATLVDAVAQPGQHQVEWNADGLPTGIYFCRYSTGSFVQTMKLLYVR
jgi:hypothetical protein